MRAAFGATVIDVYDQLTDLKNGLRLKATYTSGDGVHRNDAGLAYVFPTARALVVTCVTQEATALPRRRWRRSRRWRARP